LLTLTVNKWFQSTPTLKAKCQKERAQRQKQKATKAAKKNKKLNTQNMIPKEPLNNTASNIEIDELKSSDDNMETRPMKKAKTSPEINPYINLVTPARTTKLKTMDAHGFFTLDTTRQVSTVPCCLFCISELCCYNHFYQPGKAVLETERL
jgi:hypothetical protein